MVPNSQGVTLGSNRSVINSCKLLGRPAVMFCSRTTFPNWSRTNKSRCEAPQSVQVKKGDSSAQTGALLLSVQLPEYEI